MLEFDHHCPWLDTCIAANNRKEFVFFLLASALLLAFLMYLFQKGKLRFLRHLEHSIILLRSDWHLTAAIWYTVWRHYLTQPIATVVFLYALVLLLWVSVLLLVQLFLISINVTTNEFVNRHRFAYLWRGQRRGSVFKTRFSRGAMVNLLSFFGNARQQNQAEECTKLEARETNV